MKKLLLLIFIIASTISSVACEVQRKGVYRLDSPAINYDLDYGDEVDATVETETSSGDKVDETEEIVEAIAGKINTRFKGYDNTVVTCDEIKSALQDIENKDLAILIATEAWLLSTGNGGRLIYRGTYTLDKLPTVVVKDTTNENIIKVINYNAILKDVGLHLDENGELSESKGVNIDKVNGNIGDLERPGTTMYLREGSIFNSYIITDKDKRVAGLMFIELETTDQ